LHDVDSADAILTQLGRIAQGARYATTKLLDSPDNAEGIVVALYSRPKLLSGLEDLTGNMGKWPLVLSHWTRQPFGKNAVDEMSHPGDGETPESVLASARSFDSMLQAPRPAWRRAQRAGIPGKRVLVVTLRRPSNQRPTEGGGIDWSHRWIVGGHWRNQWYASEQIHRQIWISDYEKGPDDKPLVIKQRAFTFRR
jgi:hypothetical protein